MVVINPKGLFKGDRIAQLSDKAKLFWPWFYLSSNGHGRIEINYEQFRDEVLRGFDHPLTKEEYLGLVKEYNKSLLFLYQAQGQIWGQWDTSEQFLPRYKDAESNRSPRPDHSAFQTWKEASRKKTQAPMIAAFVEVFGSLPDAQGFPEPQETAHSDRKRLEPTTPLSSVFSEISQNFQNISACSSSCVVVVEEREEVVSTGETVAVPVQASGSLSEGKPKNQPSPIAEGDWIEFREAFTKTSSQPSSEKQWVIAQSIWRRLDFSQRLAAVQYLPKAQAADFWKVTHATALSYLENQIWTLPIPAPAKQQAQAKPVQQLPTADEIQKRREERAKRDAEIWNSPEAVAKREAEAAEIEARKQARIAARLKQQEMAHAS